MPETVGRVKEAQLDYLSLTFRPGWNREAARARVEALQTGAHAAGADRTPFRLRGYVGVATGKIAWGDRPDGSLLQLAGEAADVEAGVLLPLASNCTRVDLAVTADLSGMNVNPALEGYVSGPKHKPARGSPPAYDLRQHSKQGTTLYVGTPTSNYYARVYDKWKQSELAFYAGCFRYECQCNSKVAARCADRAVSDSDRPGFIVSYVHRYFRQRGVPVYFDNRARDVRLESYRPRSNDLSRILWLAREVKPVVDGLIGHGRAADVTAALGGNYTDPIPHPLPGDLETWLRSLPEPRVNPVDTGPGLD